ncbi:adenylate/guanylate cyclase domain-containing protein [Hydrocarboniphaga sp.]|uniref:ATP-binding protein n=1 Tax=Hydrocarboniphaga sp. TaxID=2033016 RepID=UPI00261F18B1|nr:adenylate/guanylate cyclase domain-containing protein [Hydrocarboniphaga sp.]
MPEQGRRIYTPQHLAERVLNSRAALIGERKRVTVLFVDIKGSTRMAEQAGAEVWHRILDRFFSLLGAAVHRYEGTVNQYTGDGIMALFGAPLALEDHASRACFAALEIQRTMREYADELRLSLGINLSTRAGLNTGEVIVGAIGDDLRMDYTAQGLTVNLAARMEQICEPGRIYATRNTALLTEGYFRLRDLGEMTVAGSDAPLRVYEVEGEGAAKTRLERGLARGATRLVGRELEREQLRAAMREVVAGRGQVVSVEGEAGIGKSRLCHDFALECERNGIAVHRATGVPYATAVPFHPVQTLVRRRLGLPEHGSRADIRQLAAGALLLFDPASVVLLPRLLDFLGVGDGAVSNSATGVPADRHQLFELLARLLPLSDSPQLLLVEDLHFVDAGSLSFLQMLAAQIAGSSTLLLFNFRPGASAGQLQNPANLRIVLEALKAEQIENLALQLLGAHPSVAQLPRELSKRAGGNPFFMEEAVQSLSESGQLRGVRGAYSLERAIERWTIPDTVHALVAARVDKLDEVDKHLLQSASIIGLQFSRGLLLQLVSLSEDAVAAGLRNLQLRGFVRTDSEADDVCEFMHPISQDVVYRTQLESHRREAHARLALLLEQEHPLEAVADDVAPVIAYHWRRAQEWLRATEWNFQAARWSANHGANASLAQFRLARNNIERAPRSAIADRLRVQALAGLVRQAQFTDMSTDEVEQAYRDASELAETNRDVPAQAELLISYSAEQLHRGDAREAIRLVAKAMRLAVDSNAVELIGRFRLQLLLVHSTAGYPREGAERVSEAGGDSWLTEPISHDNFMSRAFHALMLGWLGRLPEARTQLNAVFAYAEGKNRVISWMHTCWIDLANFTGDYEGVLRHGELAMERAEESGSSYFRAIALRGLGLAHVLQGDASIAIDLLKKALPLVAPGANAYQYQAQTLLTLARAYRLVGDLQRSHDAAIAAIDSAHSSHARVWEVMSWLGYLELCGQGISTPRAAEGLERVDQLIEDTGAEVARPWLWLARMRCAADQAEAAGHRARALEAFKSTGATGHLVRLQSRLDLM